MTIEASQADITRFLQAAHGGAVQFDPAAARRCAESYDQQIDHLSQVQQRLESVSELHGFGGFFSAEQLQAGFSRKARDTIALLDRYIAACYRMKEGFLISAGLHEEAEAAHAAALQALTPEPTR